MAEYQRRERVIVYEGFLRADDGAGGQRARGFRRHDRVSDGFYDELILSLHNAFSRDVAARKRSRMFLVKLAGGWAVGMAAAMLLLSGIMNTHIYAVSSLFLGFILASIPAVAWKERSVLGKNPGAALVFFVTYFSTQTAFELNLAHISLVNGLVLFVSAAVAASAMILPGISGSSLLMAFGLYAPLVQQIGALLHGRLASLPVVLVFALGALTGLMLFIRLVKAMLEKRRAPMMYAVIGMMAASLYGVIQGPTTLETALPALSASNFSAPFFAVGCALIGAITYMEHRISSGMINKN